MNLAPWTATDIMPFGKHKGKKLSEIDGGYWIWFLNEESTQRTVGLVKYIVDNIEKFSAEAEVLRAEWEQRRAEKKKAKANNYNDSDDTF